MSITITTINELEAYRIEAAKFIRLIDAVDESFGKTRRMDGIIRGVLAIFDRECERRIKGRRATISDKRAVDLARAESVQLVELIEKLNAEGKATRFLLTLLDHARRAVKLFDECREEIIQQAYSEHNAELRSHRA